MVCNDDDDCGNGKDLEAKELCNKNECEINHGGCEHQCHDTRAGHFCTCNDGYMLVNETACQG